MKKYNCYVENCTGNRVQIFIGADEATFTEWLRNCCERPAGWDCYWLKDDELPEMGVSYSCMGWRVHFYEYEE